MERKNFYKTPREKNFSFLEKKKSENSNINFSFFFMPQAFNAKNLSNPVREDNAKFSEMKISLYALDQRGHGLSNS